MKKLILLILSGASLLWSEPKVIGIFGGESCPWSKELREDVWETPSFQALLTAASIKKEEQPASQNEPETPMLVLFISRRRNRTFRVFSHPYRKIRLSFPRDALDP